MKTHGAARRQMHVEHVREIPPQVRQQGRLFRNGAEQEMLQPAADHGVEDRVLPVSDGNDLHHLAVGAGAVGLRKFAERSFRLAHARQEAALDHDLGLSRDPDVAGQAFHHRQGPALQRPGDLQLIVVDRYDRLRGEQCQRIDADHDGGVERLTGRLGHAVEREGVARQHQHAQAIGPGQLAAVNRDVLFPGARIAHDHDAGGNIGTAVVLVVGRQRQNFREIERRAMHGLLGGRRLDLLPRRRIGCRVLKARQHVGGLHSHCLGHPAAVGNEARHHRNGMAAGLREQGGTLAVEPLGIGRQPELESRFRLQPGQPAAGGEMVEPLAQAANGLRRIGSVRRHLVLGHGMKMYHSWRTRNTDDPPMLDLGTSFLASVSRDPNALAIVDGGVRLTYAQWYRRISALVAGFDRLGLRPGDHLATALQNNWQAATIHWACQFAGIIITPLNWRSTAAELDYCLANAEAKALVYEGVAAAAVKASAEAGKCQKIAVGVSADVTFDVLVAADALDAQPRASAEAWSVMLYTSGTTAKPKGVPRRQRAERAAALAQVAQNLYRTGERTLGVMPLYHTMGVRSLLAMSLIGGAFVCLPRFDVARALELIEKEKITNLYLVPTLYHDLVRHEGFKQTDVSAVRKIGFAGASMTDGLLKELQAAFSPELFVNHYGSSEIYTFTIDQNAPKKPGSAGRAGINQMVRVVRLGASSPDDIAPPGEEGEIIGRLQAAGTLPGYWRRPEADAKALRQGWYFTGD